VPNKTVVDYEGYFAGCTSTHLEYACTLYLNQIKNLNYNE
jgi:hypothetical protein